MQQPPSTQMPGSAQSAAVAHVWPSWSRQPPSPQIPLQQSSFDVQGPCVLGSQHRPLLSLTNVLQQVACPLPP
jgi:hypothetical protein